MEDYDSDDFVDYDDDYDYDSDEFIHHHGGYDDLYDDIQDEYGYDAWEPKEELELPSKFYDYHPTWKKSKKTFLDLYFLAERTKQLIDLSREYIIEKLNFDDDQLKELEKSYQHMEKHLKVTKKRSIAMLTKVIGLPDLVMDNIFIKIVESYNWHFDKFGPEEITWLYEEIGEEDSETHCEDEDQDNLYLNSLDKDRYPEYYYDVTSEFYEQSLGCVSPLKMQELGFEWQSLPSLDLEGINGIEINHSGDD